MPSEHAVLSPSAAERWLTCPASVRLSEKVPASPESSFAAEGTAAHALAEIEASREFGLVSTAQYKKAIREWRHAYGELYDEDEMQVHVDAYIELIRERLNRFPNSVLMLEQRLPTGVPRCWGTSDAVIVSPFHVEIIDLKYGQGVKVAAVENPQLRLYGVGALEHIAELIGEVKQVFITVFQPRLFWIDTEELTPQELIGWRDSIIPLAEEALSEDARFNPTDAACQWCPASGRCKAQLAEIFKDEDYEPVDPDLVSNEEIAAALGKVKFVRQWLDAMEVVALDRAYSQGETVPGYKVVLSGGRRVVSDVPGALESLAAVGYALDDVAPRKIKGIGDLEKLLKKEFDTVLATHITKTPGRPSLVPESDKRPSINPNTEAAREFKEN